MCKCASVQANLSGSSLGCKWVPFSSRLVFCSSTPLLWVKCVFFQPLHPLHWKMISFFILLSNLSNLAHIFSAVYSCVCYGRPGVINQMPWVANWDSGVSKRKHHRAKEHRRGVRWQFLEEWMCVKWINVVALYNSVQLEDDSRVIASLWLETFFLR